MPNYFQLKFHKNIFSEFLEKLFIFYILSIFDILWKNVNILSNFIFSLQCKNTLFTSLHSSKANVLSWLHF